MQALNKTAEKVFRKLTEGMTQVGDHRTVENNKSFMAVHVEVVGQTERGLLISVAHYYEQNGDLMRDPDVVFLVDERAYPISYRLDGLGLNQEAAHIQDGVWMVCLKMQADICRFCNQWMKNIKAQQF
jgi:hypothetical protein